MIFMSKKLPILVTGIPEVEMADGKKFQFMFKYGDDLRQDNLVLQMFKIMDRIWTDEGIFSDMVTYDVMETGFETGYIEFVQNAQVISAMHNNSGFYRGSFA